VKLEVPCLPSGAGNSCLGHLHDWWPSEDYIRR